LLPKRSPGAFPCLFRVQVVEVRAESVKEAYSIEFNGVITYLR